VLAELLGAASARATPPPAIALPVAGRSGHRAAVAGVGVAVSGQPSPASLTRRAGLGATHTAAAFDSCVDVANVSAMDPSRGNRSPAPTLPISATLLVTQTILASARPARRAKLVRLRRAQRCDLRGDETRSLAEGRRRQLPRLLAPRAPNDDDLTVLRAANLGLKFVLEPGATRGIRLGPPARDTPRARRSLPATVAGGRRLEGRCIPGWSRP
jgi:hypothetical protein